MKIFQIVAKPCGIIGSSWGIVLSILLIFFTSAKTVTSSVVMNAEGNIISKTLEISPIKPLVLVVIASGLIGIMGLIAMFMIQKNIKMGIIFIWTSAILLLLVNLLSLSTSILFFAPAILLLTAAAIGFLKPSINA